MSRLSVLVVLVALVGCSAPPPKTPAAVAEAEPSTLSPDQDVPLVAPDEAESAKAGPRLTETKRIGGGPDDTSVDGQRRGTTRQAQSRAASPSAARPRSFFSRATGTSSTGASNASNGSASPPVGGNFPSAPSFGSPAAR